MYYYNHKRVQRLGILTPMKTYLVCVSCVKGRQTNLPTKKILYFLLSS